MADSGVRLSIDLWHTSLAVALGMPNGQIVPVAVDGAALAPAGVAVDGDSSVRAGRDGAILAARSPQSYLRMPGQALLEDQITVGTVHVDPVDLVAAALSLAAGETRLVAGERPREVVISTPAGWVATQRRGVREAAKRAGLGEPKLATGAESIVREQMARGSVIPSGAVVVVCRLESSVGELVVVRRDRDAFEMLAAFDLGELGETPGTTLPEQAGTALVRALDAAGVDQVTAVFCHVPAGLMPELTATFATSRVPVVPLHVAEMAGAFGGARRHGPDVARADPAPPWGRVVGAGVATAVAWSAAALLTYQVVSSGTVYPATSVSPTILVTIWSAWGLAGVFAMLGATSLALAAAELRAGRTRASARPDPALGSGLILVGVLGAGAAGALGLIGAAQFDVGPVPLLRWTLSATAPLAMVLIALGLVVARTSPPGAPLVVPTPWPQRLRFPLPALLAGCLSTVVIVAAYVGVPYVDPDLWWRMERVGAFVLGWAVALMLAADPWRRVILGFVLGSTAAYAIDLRTVDVVVGSLAAAITLWWLLRLAPVAARALRGRAEITSIR